MDTHFMEIVNSSNAAFLYRIGDGNKPDTFITYYNQQRRSAFFGSFRKPRIDRFRYGNTQFLAEFRISGADSYIFD